MRVPNLPKAVPIFRLKRYLDDRIGIENLTCDAFSERHGLFLVVAFDVVHFAYTGCKSGA